MKKPVIFVFLIFVGIWIFLLVYQNRYRGEVRTINRQALSSPSPTPQPLPPLPSEKILPTDYHAFQTFNNCGPAALSMALYLYGISVSQEELGKALRPYQVISGDNDDKSVTLEEISEKSKEYGFTPYHRPMGNIGIIRQFIANDMPVITRTWTKPDEDVGHFRVIKGYDQSNNIIQDDSLQGKNLIYSSEEFNEIWKKFNYEYLVLVPGNKLNIAKQILGANEDVKKTWQNAIENSLLEISKSPDDIYARFNLSVAYYHTKEYQKSVDEFEKVENQLPFRTLWYQIEPIQSYYELQNYDRVFEITSKILNNGNRAFSELYILRGKIYQKQGNVDAAKNEFEKAVYYNSESKEAIKLLSSI